MKKRLYTRLGVKLIYATTILLFLAGCILFIVASKPRYYVISVYIPNWNYTVQIRIPENWELDNEKSVIPSPSLDNDDDEFLQMSPFIVLKRKEAMGINKWLNTILFSSQNEAWTNANIVLTCSPYDPKFPGETFDNRLDVSEREMKEMSYPSHTIEKTSKRIPHPLGYVISRRTVSEKTRVSKKSNQLKNLVVLIDRLEIQSPSLSTIDLSGHWTKDIDKEMTPIYEDVRSHLRIIKKQ